MPIDIIVMRIQKEWHWVEIPNAGNFQMPSEWNYHCRLSRTSFQLIIALHVYYQGGNLSLHNRNKCKIMK